MFFSAVLAFRIIDSKLYGCLSFCLFVCFLNFLYVLSFTPDNCLFPHSLSVIVLFFLFFRCRSSPEISKNVQGIPGQCPPSMDTTDACSLFPRNVNNLTVGPALRLWPQEIRSWGDSLSTWLASHKADAVWPEMALRPAKLSILPTGGFGL